MTKQEEEIIIQAIKQNAPQWYQKLKTRLVKKQSMISECIEIACSNDPGYQDEINRVYHSYQVKLNDVETILLNYLCLIKHKEFVLNKVDKNDPEIQKWTSFLVRYSEYGSTSTSILSLLNKQVNQTINKYRIKNRPGRPKGSGKTVFTYNGKEYHTIQECADDYHITKQGMFKKLKKNHII